MAITHTVSFKEAMVSKLRVTVPKIALDVTYEPSVSVFQGYLLELDLSGAGESNPLMTLLKGMIATQARKLVADWAADVDVVFE